MKKKDWILVCGVLALAFFCWLVPRGLGLFAKPGENVLKISVKGELYGIYSMQENQIIKIGNTNICEIKENKVIMLQAECPDHLCMHQGPIDTQGETIVCLPNRVVLEVAAKDKVAGASQIDSIVK